MFNGAATPFQALGDTIIAISPTRRLELRLSDLPAITQLVRIEAVMRAQSLWSFPQQNYLSYKQQWLMALDDGDH